MYLNNPIKLAACSIFFIFVALDFAPCFAESFTAYVIGISDGDTITVLKPDKTQVKVRLDGIDCPEDGQAFGNKAKKTVSNTVFKKNVTVHTTGKDRYGRTLANIVIDEVWLNWAIVRRGYGWHFKKYSSDAQLAEAERLARSERLGLWREKNPIPPWEYRKSEKSAVKQHLANPVVADSSIYHGNSKSYKFHRSSCKHYNCKNCTVILKSKKEALAKGFSPCGICKP